AAKGGGAIEACCHELMCILGRDRRVERYLGDLWCGYRTPDEMRYRPGHDPKGVAVADDAARIQCQQHYRIDRVYGDIACPNSRSERRRSRCDRQSSRLSGGTQAAWAVVGSDCLTVDVERSARDTKRHRACLWAGDRIEADMIQFRIVDEE